MIIIDKWNVGKKVWKIWELVEEEHSDGISGITI